MHILKLHNKLMYIKDVCNLYTDLEISEKKICCTHMFVSYSM